MPTSNSIAGSPVTGKRAERAACVLLACLAMLAPLVLAAGDAPNDLALIEFLGNSGTRVRGPDPLWLLEELSRSESKRPAPQPAPPVRPEVKP